MLWASEQAGASVVFKGARVIDPVEAIDGTLDVRIDDGVIAALGDDVDTNEHRVVDAAGLVLAPAFVDPHVHLRTPGREDEETIASGTRARSGSTAPYKRGYGRSAATHADSRAALEVSGS